MSDISSSSSSSSSEYYLHYGVLSSDEEDFEEVEDTGRPRNEFLEETIPQYNDVEFMEHFRVSRRVMTQIATDYKNSEMSSYQSGSHGKLSASDQILIFLWFAGHPTTAFRNVACKFKISISSLCRIVKRISYFLSNSSQEVIKWPMPEERIEIEMHFRQERMPGMIGIIDGTHIKIDKPEVDPDSYLNKKKYFSVHMQAVCDHKMKIRDVYIGNPGSMHDREVFQSSPLGNNLPQKCSNEYFLLGDTGYPCQRHLVTPFQDSVKLTEEQRQFNYQLSKHLYVMEHCFGTLKQKFRQLYHIKLRSINDIVHFIRACCVLHNLALDDDFVIDAGHIVANRQENVNGDGLEMDDDYGDDMKGIIFRNNLMSQIL